MSKLLYGLLAFMMVGCVQAVAETKDPAAPPVARQVIVLQGVEKALSLNGVTRITLDLNNGETPSCQINAHFPNVILLGSKFSTCEGALMDLVSKTAPKQEEVTE